MGRLSGLTRRSKSISGHMLTTSRTIGLSGCLQRSSRSTTMSTQQQSRHRSSWSMGGTHGMGGSAHPAADEWLAKLTESRRAAKEAMEKAAVAMKRSYDVSKRPSREYSKGDLVSLDTWNLKMDRPSKKLDNKRAGPFTIEEKVGPAGYRLKLPRAWRIHRVFNELLLTPYLPPSFPSQNPPPPPLATIQDDHLEYEVEAILDVKKVG